MFNKHVTLTSFVVSARVTASYKRPLLSGSVSVAVCICLAIAAVLQTTSALQWRSQNLDVEGHMHGVRYGEECPLFGIFLDFLV